MLQLFLLSWIPVSDYVSSSSCDEIRSVAGNTTSSESGGCHSGGGKSVSGAPMSVRVFAMISQEIPDS